MAIQKMGALQRVSGKMKQIPGAAKGAMQSKEEIKAPLMFSSKPGSTAYLSYITPEEMALLRADGRGFSEMGNGPVVGGALRQHMGPNGLPSFNGDDGSGSGDDGPSGGDMGGSGPAGNPGGVGHGGPSDPSGVPGADNDPSMSGGGPAGPGDGHGGGSWEGNDRNGNGRPDDEEIIEYLGSDEFLTNAYGLHPGADPNAYLWDMQGYYTPSSYADMALGYSGLSRDPRMGYNSMLNTTLASEFDIPDDVRFGGGWQPGERSFQQFIDDTGQRGRFDQVMSSLPEGLTSGNASRYMRGYLAASGVGGAYGPDPFQGRAYGDINRERVAIPDWFQPGGNRPGAFTPDYSGAVDYAVDNYLDLSQDEDLMGAAQSYLDANPEVLDDPYYATDDPFKGLEHYLRVGREQGMEFPGQLPDKMIGFNSGGRVLPLVAPSGSGQRVDGPGNGRSDDIPAMLSRDEYVLPAHFMAALGDGSPDAGADMMDRIVEDTTQAYSQRLRGLPGPRR